MTKKQKDFVAEYVVSENGAQAALKSYDTKDPIVAKSIATEILTYPHVAKAVEIKRKSLKQALIDRGITEDYISEKVEVLLTAKDKEGSHDYTAIDKGLKHATLIHGVVDPNENQKTQNIYNFIFSPQGQEKVKVIEDEIKSMLTKGQNNDQTS